MEHQNVVRLVKNTNFAELSGNTRILETGAPVFDATTFEIWGSLLNGGELHLVSNEVILDEDCLRDTLERYCINTLWLSSPPLIRSAPRVSATMGAASLRPSSPPITSDKGTVTPNAANAAQRN